jgi:hypothetical protein
MRAVGLPTEFVANRGSSIGLLADRPKKVIASGGEDFIRERSISGQHCSRKHKRADHLRI